MEEFGQVDIMLDNAAAPGQEKWVWEQTVENFNATIAIDLTAAMLCTREVLNRSMLERKSGTIIGSEIKREMGRHCDRPFACELVRHCRRCIELPLLSSIPLLGQANPLPLSADAAHSLQISCSDAVLDTAALKAGESRGVLADLRGRYLKNKLTEGDRIFRTSRC